MEVWGRLSSALLPGWRRQRETTEFGARDPGFPLGDSPGFLLPHLLTRCAQAAYSLATPGPRLRVFRQKNGTCSSLETVGVWAGGCPLAPSTAVTPPKGPATLCPLYAPLDLAYKTQKELSGKWGTP